MSEQPVEGQSLGQADGESRGERVSSSHAVTPVRLDPWRGLSEHLVAGSELGAVASESERYHRDVRLLEQEYDRVLHIARFFDTLGFEAIQLHDVRAGDGSQDDFASHVRWAQVEIADLHRLRSYRRERTHQLIGAELGALGECAVADDVGRLQDGLDLRGETDAIPRGFGGDVITRLTGYELHANGSSGTVIVELNQAHVDPASLELAEGPLSKGIVAHTADEHRATAQLPGVIGDVREGTSQAWAGWEEIPQELTPADDQRRHFDTSPSGAPRRKLKNLPARGWLAPMRWWIGLLLVSCNVPEPPGSTGGTDEPVGPCGRGFVVVDSDYQSTNVSLVALDGRVLSSSFLSSATSGAKLSSPLSKDIVLPTSPQIAPSVVLLDRDDASVLTWIDVASAKVDHQLSVGLKSNPHDYVPLSADKAYVTRYDPTDGGGDDVAVVDPSIAAVVARIPLDQVMADSGGYLARPSRAVLSNGRVVVALEAYDATFESTTSSRLVAIDTASDQVEGVLVLEGLHGCWGLAPSPDGERVAVSCAGRFQGADGSSLEESGIVVVDGSSLTERARFSAAAVAGTPLGSGLSWVDDRTVLAIGAGSDGAVTPPHDDVLFQLDIETGVAEVLLSSDAEPYTLGDVACAPACGVCLAADAGRNVVQHFHLEDGALSSPRAIHLGDAIGLQPRVVGRF